MTIIASVTLSESLLHVGESLGTSWRFFSSNPLATNQALALIVSSWFPLREQTQRTDIHFDDYMVLHHEYCYLPSFSVLFPLQY